MYLRRNITVDSEHMPSLRDSRPVGHVVPRVAVAIATLPVAIECRRVATHMPLRRDSNVVASRFECRCVAIRMSALRDSIVVGFPSVDWVAPTFRLVFFSKGRAGGSSPYLVPRSNSAVDGDLAFRPALRPIYSGGRNVRPRLEAMQGRGGSNAAAPVKRFGRNRTGDQTWPDGGNGR